MALFLLSITLIFLSALNGIQSARILGVFTSPIKSHLLIHSSVAETLAAAGHNVTIIGSFPNLLTQAQYRYIHIAANHLEPTGYQQPLESSEFVQKKFYRLISGAVKNANNCMQNSVMQEFLTTYKAGDFDVLILGYYNNGFMLGLGAHFQCPIILSFMLRPFFSINYLMANPQLPAYVPNLFGNFNTPMSFPDRLQNYLYNFIEDNVMKPLMWQINQKLYIYNFPADRYPPLEEVYKNISLVLTNHHFSQGPIRPNVPALIEIGGIQIKEQPDDLPKDLSDIVETSKKGVIFFSLGTNVQGSNLAEDKAKMIFNVLSQLPYTVLLKWGDSHFPGHADNMIYRSWLPQDDILAHPKVKLFITHGGMGSVVESQYHGVPMIGIPFFGDQHSNIASVEKSGFGLGLDYASLTEEGFRRAVTEVLENSSYTENVQKFSKLYRDRPMTPRQLVRYWVEYVIRHNGAKHMQSPAIFMPWWQLYSIDVVAFLLTALMVAVFLIVGLCKFMCCRGNSADKETMEMVSKSKKQK